MQRKFDWFKLSRAVLIKFVKIIVHFFVIIKRKAVINSPLEQLKCISGSELFYYFVLFVGHLYFHDTFMEFFVVVVDCCWGAIKKVILTFYGKFFFYVFQIAHFNPIRYKRVQKQKENFCFVLWIVMMSFLCFLWHLEQATFS